MNEKRRLENASNVSRRKFLSQSALATGALALGAPWADAARVKLPKPRRTGIEHIIVVMMENRSFDHMVGWIPGADGQQAGLAYPDRNGNLVNTFSLAPDYQGCAYNDPDHTYEGGRVEFNNGACDGWLLAGQNDIYSIGYYNELDLPFYSQVAANFTSCDGYFSAIMAGTYPNRIYQYAAQTDRLTNSVAISSLPTIWDRLASRRVPARYYFTDIPFTALWGVKYLPITRHISQFYADCAAGTLPAVSFVDPKFFNERMGTSRDDHPHADIRDGQAFLHEIYQAVTSGPGWENTALIINYDEWGGFFDHVPPTRAPVPSADRAAGDTSGLRGFRTPFFLISPFARRGYVAKGIYDHTSVLKFIEWRYGLPSLTIRDATARNLADMLDFANFNPEVPALNVPAGPFGSPCPIEDNILDKWELLAEQAFRSGFSLFMD